MQMTMFYKEAGNRIYLARMARGYTREYLAEMASVSSKFLYEIETGKKGFSAAVLYNLSKALGIDCDYILTGQEREGYDKRLLDILQLFNLEQSEKISTILKQIYELI